METDSIEATPYINENKTDDPTRPDHRDYFGLNASCLLYSMGATPPRHLLDRCLNSLSYAKIY